MHPEPPSHFARLWSKVDKRALFVTAACVTAWRLLTQIPVVDITHGFISTRLAAFDLPGSFPAIGSHSVAFTAYSLNDEGITPYVQVLVLTSFATVISRRLRLLVNSQDGRLRLERWIRAAALLLSLGGGYGWTFLAQNAGALPDNIDWFVRLCVCLQLAGGTAVMIVLASMLDEFGLGFGYGAIIFYALDILAIGVHRVADYVAYAPSVEALYRPLAVWAGFSVAISIAGMAMFLAYRRLWIREDDGTQPSPIDLKLVMPGILRPGLMAFAIVGLPFAIGNLTGGQQPILSWFIERWSPNGPVAWLDVTYVVVEGAALIVFASAVVWVDWFVNDISWELEPHGVRLGAISGVIMAALIAVARPLANSATTAAGTHISVSGFNILLVVGLLLAVILRIEGRRHPFVTTESVLP